MRSAIFADGKLTPPGADRGVAGGRAGTAIGGLFNTFPYTSFSQMSGLVGVTGVRSRFVCVAGGAIMVVLGLIPKMGRWSKACPRRFWAARGLMIRHGRRDRHPHSFDGGLQGNKHNLFIVAVSLALE